MSAVLPHPITNALNHVLRSAPLALERLSPHAGKTAVLNVGPARFSFTVQTTGEVASAVAGAARDLEVRISPFLVPRLAMREDAAHREIEMQGDPAFAAEVAYLLRHLTWDFEDDLARVVGDVPAHRIASAFRSVDAWGRDAALRLAQGATEYWTEESGLIASRLKVESFVRDAAALASAVDAIEERIARLEKR